MRGILAPLIVILRANWFRFRMSFVSSAQAQALMQAHKAASTLPPLKGVLVLFCIVLFGFGFGFGVGFCFVQLNFFSPPTKTIGT